MNNIEKEQKTEGLETEKEAVYEQRKSEEIVSNSKLLESGIYFGHKKEFWNPKMKPYILGIKKKTHIIDIKKTKKTLEFAYDIIYRYAKKGATFVFVGTRKQAKKTIRENALRVNSHYVSERWLGGTLTNSRTIFSRVNRMLYLEKLALDSYNDYTKKEGLLLERELQKLQKNLSGIKDMRQRPTFMIVADPSKDEIAVKEARKKGVKIIGVVDSNANPDLVDIPIPGNDDSIKSVTLIITILADAIAEAKGGQVKFAYQLDDSVELPEDKKREERRSFNQNYNRKFDTRKVDVNKILSQKKLDELRVFELKIVAESRGVPNYQKLTRDQLVETLKPILGQSKSEDK